MTPSDHHTVSSRTIYAIRTHRDSESVRRLHSELTAALGPERVFVVVDELGGKTDWPADYSRVAVTPALVSRLSLRGDIPNIGWLCGDYCYYALADAIEFDYAWLIEWDVQFVDIDIAAFFGQFADCDLDFVAKELVPAEPGWPWRRSLEALGPTDVWRCLFPLTRASRPAIAAALELRRQVSGTATARVAPRGDTTAGTSDDDLGLALPQPVDQPNDEGVFATAVVAAGLEWRDLASFNPDYYPYFSTKIKYLAQSVVRLHDGPQVVHPSLSQSDYTEYVRHEFPTLVELTSKMWMIATYEQALHPSDHPILRRALPWQFGIIASSDLLVDLVARTVWHLSHAPLLRRRPPS